MSFYTKYQELGLGDIDFVSWLKFDSNLNDSGPNGNNWTYALGNGSSLLATPGIAYFTDAAIELSYFDAENFTAFLDIEKVSGSDDSVIFSSTFSGGSFAFVWGPSGNFYVCSRNASGDISYVGHFRVSEPSKRCVLALSKFQNSFLLYLYEPFSGELEMEFLSADYSTFFEGAGLRVGDQSFGLGSDSNFIIREFALIGEGMPGFCILELAKELFNSSSDAHFKFPWLATADKTGESAVENLQNVSKSITGVILPYSISPAGFSFLGKENTDEMRVYSNGVELLDYDLQDGYLTYDDMEESDIVLADFFVGGENTGNYTYFFGESGAVLPKGAAAVYDVDGLRLSDNYRQVSEISLSYGIDIVFPSTQDLAEI